MFVGFLVASTLLRSYGDFSAFTGRGIPQMPIRALFKEQAGI